ncbi:BrnT family toxin [Sphingomonas sp. SRS2]|uniref:BrnT family toxin n=1 Tax=Sphingomonas sp. SRS2 TaxID=133190 RepID=UPI0009FE7D4B|nr:BrnT family toxin [Sphingomonas sp. SRS2]
MRISYDEEKRRKVLNERQIDFDDAAEFFDAFHLTKRDDRDYKEERYISIGEMKGQVILVVWTPREDSRRIITMWKADHGERERYQRRRSESG